MNKDTKLKTKNQENMKSDMKHRDIEGMEIHRGRKSEPRRHGGHEDTRRNILSNIH